MYGFCYSLVNIKNESACWKERVLIIFVYLTKAVHYSVKNWKINLIWNIKGLHS